MSDDPQEAIVRAASELHADELILSPSPAEAPGAQLERIVARWREISGGRSGRLTVRMVGKDLDIWRDVAGGSRIPPAPDDDGETARALKKNVVD